MSIMFSQEIEPGAGETLCKLFALDHSSDYERVISRVKRKRESLQASGPPNKPISSRLDILRGNGYTTAWQISTLRG